MANISPRKAAGVLLPMVSLPACTVVCDVLNSYPMKLLDSAMTRDEFLRALEQVLMLKSGALKAGVALADVPEWDSMGIVDFQGLVDESLGMDLAPERITACESVDDLLALVGDKLAE